ncbi:hypothetical protein GCM10017783_18730 [Deinococcus piscis]|uniref:Copper resistance protein D domain-containing protein n=1 Tax=Deinococcus piscis TaxID=394230 RepID=A0ABQ3K6V0_9DEIO|nr:CopD family protein [Deinococcus piscis]GHG06360.1 hypothetical protein GCM10017783_18730 [Deinococcus piscis]
MLTLSVWLSLAQHLGLALLLGGAFTRRWWLDSWPLWPLGLGLVLLGLGSLGAAAWTLAQFGLLTPADLSGYLLAEPAGRALVWALLGGVLLLAAEAGRWRLPGLVPPAGLLLYGLGAQGHAALGGVPTTATQMLHLAAMSTWLGGVLALAVGKEPPRDELSRMTTPALLSLLVLAFTGAFAALVNGGHLGTLRTSPYGAVLAGKLALVLAAVSAAAWLRWRVYRALPARPALRLELALLLLAVLASAWLGETPPPAQH